MKQIAEVKKRQEEIAFLHFEGKSAKEISEDSGISIRTVQRDIRYVEKHMEEFLW